MSNIAIVAENLSKAYLVGHQSGHRESYTALRDVLAREARTFARKGLDLIRGRQIMEGDEVEEFWALQDVSFELKQGEVLGIIGRNGAGKSTLLKILSRITEPTRGRVILRGRVACLLEVGTGFHPELTGRENIFLNGAILGMTREEIKTKFDEIVAFAEVERFLDTPVKRYSSGMYVRLAFAVAAHLEPEILIVDEVLAVGDADFQKKCLGKMSHVARDGRTVIFVSHNLNAVERLCQRVLWLDAGQLLGVFDDVRDAVAVYSKSATQRDVPCRWINCGGEFENDYFVPERLELLNNAQPFSNADPIEIAIIGRIGKTDPALQIGLGIYDERGQLLFWSFTTDEAEQRWPRLNRGPVQLSIKIPARLLNEGTYRVELLASLYYRAWLFEPGRNAPSITFSIQGGLSDSPYWDRKRPGILAPVLSWNSQTISRDMVGLPMEG
jgi:lipopolysaccharide transport system ATP-binding protein